MRAYFKSSILLALLAILFSSIQVLGQDDAGQATATEAATVAPAAPVTTTAETADAGTLTTAKGESITINWGLAFLAAVVVFLAAAAVQAGIKRPKSTHG